MVTVLGKYSRVPYLLLLAAAPLNAQTIPAPPFLYTVTRVPAGSNAINNLGQITGANGAAFLWTPLTPNGSAGNLVPLGLPSSNAAAINDRGQIAGTSQPNATTSHTFLWTPDSPNAATGTVTSFLDDPLNVSFATAINNYGQIAGVENGTAYIWTPAAANGATGSLNTDSRFNSPRGIAGINDFGQAITNYPPALFTPSTPNGSGGTFTPIAGPGNDPNTFLIAINRHGIILGETNARGSANVGFLWSPTQPNSATGTAVPIPLPPGFSSMFLAGLNGHGDIVGSVATADSRIPFLYTGGVLYDLSTVGRTPVAINDQGQILFSEGTIATPRAPPPPPGAVPVTIQTAFNPNPFSLQPDYQNVDSPSFTVTGSGCSPAGYNSGQKLFWVPGSACNVSFLSPQSNSAGTRAVFQNWQDGVAANPRTIVAPTEPATYTAIFTPQYLVTASANPPGAGTVSGGGWYTFEAQAGLNAAPATGYRLKDWTPAVSPPGSLSALISIRRSMTISADFEPLASIPANYQLTQLSTHFDLAGFGALNNAGQAVGVDLGFYPSGTASLWTPVSLNSPAGTGMSIPGLAGYSLPTGINDRGQIVAVSSTQDAFGDVARSQAFLWSPDSPNGISGSATQFVPTANGPTVLAGINNYGQIAGSQGQMHSLSITQSGFLWIPSSPNGSAGTLYTDSRLNGVTGINDFGQAIVNGLPPDNQPPTLFTPSAPNTADGSFTTIAGLPGPNPALVAINKTGTIVASSAGHAFLWTPAAPNTNTGAITEIPAMPGFVSVNPTAMNSQGDVVGTIARADNSATPFLYSGSTYYDLSTIRGVTGSPLAINDHGQILLTNFQLLTPSSSLPPTPVSAAPDNGSGSSETFTFTFTDPRGWQDLEVLNILISSSLDGRNACYLAYRQSSNQLYLVGDDGASLTPPLSPGGPGGVGNSQCAMYTSYGTVDAAGGALTLTVLLTFQSSFAGNKIIYLAARDRQGGNSGWQAAGVWSVPGPPPQGPSVTGLTPPTSYAGSTPRPLTFTFTIPGNQKIAVADILINDALDGRRSCYLAYVTSTHTLDLVDDAGDAGGPYQSVTLPVSGNVSNSQCSIGLGPPEVVDSGDALSLTLYINFSPSFQGTHVIYAAARGDTTTSGWQSVGTVIVP